MPARILPLVSGENYHVINRGVSATLIYKNKYDYRRFISTFRFYQYEDVPFEFSRFLSLSRDKREALFVNLKKNGNKLVDIIAFCLMPNHYHFFLKQIKKNGVMNFIRLTLNSYSRYFNNKHKRKGGLFEGRFKAVRIETEEQFLHLSRYIHLNPYSGYIVKDINSLLDYPYSSLPEYLDLNKLNICSKKNILGLFDSINDYKRFVLDEANYQRNLEIIKHQLLE